MLLFNNRAAGASPWGPHGTLCGGWEPQGVGAALGELQRGAGRDVTGQGRDLKLLVEKFLL